MAKLELDDITTRLGELPAISSAASVLLGMIDDPDVTREEVSYLVSVDQMLCAEAFKYANSAAIGASRKIESVSEIVDYLGLNTLKQIAVLVIGKGFIKDPKIWFNSVFLANTAQEIAHELGEDSRFSELVYMAALFQSYGIVVFETLYNKDYAAILQEKDFFARLAKEKETFNYNHLEISSIVLSRMGIPSSITEIIESQADVNSNRFNKHNAVIELARALSPLEHVDDEGLAEALDAEMIQSIRTRFELADLKIDAEFTKKMFDKVHELTNL